jgi:phosphate transport system substrate-binding protein
MMKPIVTALIAAVAFAAPTASAQPQKNLRGAVKVDGSSTVYPITEAVAEEFKAAAPGVNVTVGISGTGGGFKKFAIGEIDISDASRPIKKEEHEKAAESHIDYIELPVAFDGLSIVVNPRNTWVDKLTIDEIKKIFLDGNYAKTWKDVRPSWPDKPIKLFSPGTDSGTFDYFKEVIAGSSGSLRSDMSVSEDDNVLVKGVEGNEAAIGFFGYAYYVENKDQLKVVPVDGGKGAVAPTEETILNGTYAPFSRPLFIYVNKKSAARPEVKAFVEFYLAKVSELLHEVGYVQIPTEVTKRAQVNFAALKTGTQFMDPSGAKVHGALLTIYK